MHVIDFTLQAPTIGREIEYPFVYRRLLLQKSNWIAEIYQRAERRSEELLRRNLMITSIREVV